MNEARLRKMAKEKAEKAENGFLILLCKAWGGYDVTDAKVWLGYVA